MRRTNAVLFLLAGSAALLTTVDVALPGDKEEFPEGCVSCHALLEDGADHRLGPALEEIGHRRLGEKVKMIPSDCKSCHESDEMTFAELIHQAHWREADTNVFLERFGGDCRHCHAMDASTGRVSVREGARNW